MNSRLWHCVTSSRKLKNLYNHESRVTFKSIASRVSHKETSEQDAEHDVERYELDLEENGIQPHPYRLNLGGRRLVGENGLFCLVCVNWPTRL